MLKRFEAEYQQRTARATPALQGMFPGSTSTPKKTFWCESHKGNNITIQKTLSEYSHSRDKENGTCKPALKFPVVP